MAKSKKFQDLDLSNAFLFAAALEDADTCRMVLEMILGYPVGPIRVKAESNIFFDSKFRYVRLDIYASDEVTVEYDLEMQNSNQNNLPQRSRYYQAEMDVASLEPGQDFGDLKDNVVIFICSFDPFDRELYRYTFQNTCNEAGFPLGDGTQKIFLNTKGINSADVPKALVHFLKYVENSTESCVEQTNDPCIRRLHDRIALLKRKRGLEERYMTVEEWAKIRAKEMAGEMAEEMAEEMAREMAREMAEGIAEEIAEEMAEEMAKESARVSKAEDILELLKDYGTVSSNLHDIIMGQEDSAVLQQWVKLAARADSIEAFQQAIAQQK